DQLDRLAGGCAHGKRRTTTAIAIDAGHHDAGDIETAVEGAGDVDRVLTGQGVDDEQDFVRLGDLLDGDRFGHQLFIDMGAAGRVENEHVITAETAFALGAAGDLDRRFGRNDGQRIDADLFAE